MAQQLYCRRMCKNDSDIQARNDITVNLMRCVPYSGKDVWWQNLCKYDMQFLIFHHGAFQLIHITRDIYVDVDTGAYNNI